MGRRSTPSSRSGTLLRVVPYGGGAAAPPYGGRMGGLDFSGGLAAHAALPPHFDLLALFLWTIIAACFDVFVSVRREGLVFKHNYICPVARKNAETIASFRSTRRRPTGVARRIARARKKGTATGDSSAGKTEERLQRRPGRGARGAAAAGRQLGGDVHLRFQVVLPLGIVTNVLPQSLLRVIDCFCSRGGRAVREDGIGMIYDCRRYDVCIPFAR